MTLNFSEVLTAFTTYRYNKTNMLIFIAIMIIPNIIAIVLNNWIISLLLLFLLTFFSQGYYAIASHNEGLKSKNVLIDISPNTGKIFEIGFKYLTGISTLYIIVFLPVILLTAVCISQAILASTGNVPSAQTIIAQALALFLFTILGIILSFKYIIPAMLLFFKTLALSDMFSLSKINQFGSKISKDYWTYILFSVLVSIIINVVVSCFSGFVRVNMESNMMKINPLQVIQQVSLLYLFTSSLTFIGTTLILSNLNGQVIRNTIVEKRETDNHSAMQIDV